MMRALYSGVSGLQTHQIKMDVVANNIANVNTTGFKKGQVTFQDMLSQTLSGGQAGVAADDVGGINPQQIGMGVMVGAITNIHTQGAPTTTGKATDLMIQGEGYFILQDATDVANSTYHYSRAGAFMVDNDGSLVNSANGMLVCDDAGTPITIPGSSPSISPDGTISYIDASGAPVTLTEKIGIATFPNAQGLTKAGENMYTESPASGAADHTAPSTDTTGSLISGALEMSNVDLAQEFVDMIITERGYQANSRTIRTADEMLQELINLKR
ncbi:MAG: flagellar hook-basal body complex protein [Syntrophomonadaceae bacterium]|nr:flagellar hook-basal body complex protein [Syntrophomonadaceae bacterium]